MGALAGVKTAITTLKDVDEKRSFDTVYPELVDGFRALDALGVSGSAIDVYLLVE